MESIERSFSDNLCVCVFVYIICMRVCMYACMYECWYVCRPLHMYVCMYIFFQYDVYLCLVYVGLHVCNRTVTRRV